MPTFRNYIHDVNLIYEGAFFIFCAAVEFGVKTAAKSCGRRFGFVHSRICYAASDLALNRAANFDCSFARAL